MDFRTDQKEPESPFWTRGESLFSISVRILSLLKKEGSLTSVILMQEMNSGQNGRERPISQNALLNTMSMLVERDYVAWDGLLVRKGGRISITNRGLAFHFIHPIP